ncbi:MAG: hypothetical protein M0Q92_06255 [Methanoregula sp.]|nr:hypothetical protein [Methanoregula sp.]
MKTRVLILIALIIALAAMVAPVLGDEPVVITGDTPTLFNFDVVNASIDFGEFDIDENYISPTHPDASGTPTWSVVNLTTNDATWSITIADTASNGGYMKSGALSLINPLKVRNASVISGTTSGPSDPQDITGSAEAIFSGTPVNLLYIPLEFSQLVTNLDPKGTDFTTTVTFAYS